MANTTWTSHHTELRDVLAQMYLDKESSLRIVVEAGVNPTLVDFRDNAADNWFEIIRKVDAQGMLIALIERALIEHKSNETLKEAIVVLQEGGEITKLVSVPLESSQSSLLPHPAATPRRPSPRLTNLGFQYDPFAYPEAEKMPPDILEQVFVSHPEFDEYVMDFNRSTVLLAPPGSGKTAGRLWLATTLHRRLADTLHSRPPEDGFPRTPLVVYYDDFEQILEGLQDVRLSDHAEHLLAAIAKAVYNFIMGYQQRFIERNQRTQQWWWLFLRTYLKGEPVESRVQGTALAGSKPEFIDNPVLFSVGSSLVSILETVSRRLADLGLDSMYILVDGVDGYVETQQLSNLEALIEPFLNTLSLLSLQDVTWKFFLPDDLRKIVLDSGGYKTGRLDMVSVRWDEKSLQDFLHQRLAWASDGEHKNFMKLCEQALLLIVLELERELVRMAQNHKRLGPPRALLSLARSLFEGRVM